MHRFAYEIKMIFPVIDLRQLQFVLTSPDIWILRFCSTDNYVMLNVENLHILIRFLYQNKSGLFIKGNIAGLPTTDFDFIDDPYHSMIKECQNFRNLDFK